jgi:hypothetical protein
MNQSYASKNNRTQTGPGPADYAGLKDAAAEIQRMRLSARRELELARKIRADACRYQQETAIRARSEAQQLILKARLAMRREIEGLTRKAAEEVQRVLADIRVIRITAQEELAAQRRFTDAARLCSMNSAMSEEYLKPAVKDEKQLTTSG